MAQQLGKTSNTGEYCADYVQRLFRGTTSPPAVVRTTLLATMTRRSSFFSTMSSQTTVVIIYLSLIVYERPRGIEHARQKARLQKAYIRKACAPQCPCENFLVSAASGSNG